MVESGDGQTHVAIPQEVGYTHVVMPQEKKSDSKKLDLLQGTLDVMVLKTLEAMGPLHGYGIARRIEQVSDHQVLLNQGTIYAALVRAQQKGWITPKWGVSESNRRAKYYSITRKGRRHVAQETEDWKRLANVMGRFLEPQGGES